MKYTAVLLLLVYVHCRGCQGQGSTVNNDPVLNSRIERPCEVYDIPCIRSYFAKHGRCKPAQGRVPDPFFRPKDTNYLPKFNVTGNQMNIILKGLNGGVKEFYINRDTDRVVLAVEFKNLSINATTVYVVYHRTAKEPVITKSFNTEMYPSVTVTAVIPGAEHLQIGESQCHADVPALPTFSFGPEAALSNDPTIPVRFAAIVADLPTFVQEAFLTRSPYYMAVYIKYVICDFGLPLDDNDNYGYNNYSYR